MTDTVASSDQHEHDDEMVYVVQSLSTMYPHGSTVQVVGLYRHEQQAYRAAVENLSNHFEEDACERVCRELQDSQFWNSLIRRDDKPCWKTFYDHVVTKMNHIAEHTDYWEGRGDGYWCTVQKHAIVRNTSSDGMATTDPIPTPSESADLTLNWDYMQQAAASKQEPEASDQEPKAKKHRPGDDDDDDDDDDAGEAEFE